MKKELRIADLQMIDEMLREVSSHYLNVLEDKDLSEKAWEYAKLFNVLSTSIDEKTKIIIDTDLPFPTVEVGYDA